MRITIDVDAADPGVGTTVRAAATGSDATELLDGGIAPAQSSGDATANDASGDDGGGPPDWLLASIAAAETGAGDAAAVASADAEDAGAGPVANA